MCLEALSIKKLCLLNNLMVSLCTLLRCQGAELHYGVALDPVVGIVVGVGVHWAVLKPVQSTQHGQKHISGH